MRCFAGLDVSLHSTAVCIIDRKGNVVREGICASDPDALAAFLKASGFSFSRVGVEASSMAEWLYRGLAKARVPVVCIEARQASHVLKTRRNQASHVLKTRRNKTDKNDARGIAEIMRTGLYVSVHIKSPEARRVRILLTARGLVLTKALDLENAIGGFLRGFGLKMRRCAADKFAGQVEQLAREQRDVLESISPLMAARAELRRQLLEYDRLIKDFVQGDQVCRRLMTAPGVGVWVAAVYRSSIDQPERFRNSRTVGAHLGLTPRIRQSGTIDISGRISRWGDRLARTALFTAANVILNPRRRTCALTVWGLGLVQRRGRMKATVAVARRLAGILHRMWIDQADYQDWRGSLEPIGSADPVAS